MNRKRLLVTPLVVGLLAIAVAFVAAPGAVFGAAPALESAATELDPSLALLGAAGLLAVLTLLRGATGRSAASAPASLDVDPDERTPHRRNTGYPVIGGELDDAYERATDYDEASGSGRESARNEVQEELRALATRTHARRTGGDPDAAGEAVRSGEWTDDSRAAAFLAGEDGPTTPLSLWLIDLLTGRDPFERGAQRALAEIRERQSAAARGDRS